MADIPNLERYLEYLVAVNTSIRVPDQCLSDHEEVLLIQRVMGNILESLIIILIEVQTSDPGTNMEELVEEMEE